MTSVVVQNMDVSLAWPSVYTGDISSTTSWASQPATQGCRQACLAVYTIPTQQEDTDVDTVGKAARGGVATRSGPGACATAAACAEEGGVWFRSTACGCSWAASGRSERE
jgi:hypothetical protein